ncbi:MAG: redoxin domain-containing protein [Bacteroidota bacterium]
MTLSVNTLMSIIIPIVLEMSFLGMQDPRPASEAKGLPVGVQAPLFTAIDKDGKIFELAAALRGGPVVLIFYRGQWCPYCNRHLKALQDSLDMMHSKGATVVAVSPEKPQFLLKTAKKTGAQFRLLFDEGFSISNAYDVTFKPEENQLKVYNEKLGADLAHSQSDESERLPIPATFIIDKGGTIVWRHFDPDYHNRSAVREILEHIP